MYFKVRINGADFGVFGHPHVLNMHLAVQWACPRSGDSGGSELFASAVCMDDGKKYFYDWIQHPVSSSDIVEIAPTDETTVPEPRVIYEMQAV